MFKDDLKIKAALAAFFFYLLATTMVFAVVVHYSIPPGIFDPQALQRFAESDPTLLAWQSWLGVTVGILAGFIAAQWSGARGLKNSLLVGLLLVFYGVLGIYMHPSHTAWMQAGKLITPVPICLFGGWLRLRFRPVR